MNRIAVCLCTLLLPLPAAGQANPLAPLAKLHAALTKGMGVAIKGKDVVKAFKPLPVRVRPGLVDAVMEAGGVTARVLAMEIELVFRSEDMGSYYLRTEVHPAKRGPVLLSFKGRASEGARAIPFAKYRGLAAPLGTAGATLAKVVVGPACGRLPVATAADFPFMPPGRLIERMTESMRHTRHRLAEECANLVSLKPIRAELRVGDVSFAILGADSMLVGIVEAHLELDGSGALSLDVERFKGIEMGHHHPRPGPHPHPQPGQPLTDE